MTVGLLSPVYICPGIRSSYVEGVDNEESVESSLYMMDLPVGLDPRQL